MKQEHKKISYTAILCARSLAENTKIPYAKEIWEETKAQGKNEKEITFRTTNLLSKYFKGIGLLHSFLEGRYLAINRVLKRLKEPFVIELASGLTPRGLEFEKKKIGYIETDLSNIVKIKKKIYSKLSKNKVKIHSLNVLEKDEFIKLAEEYKKKKTKKPLAIIHTGLWTYLNKEEQEILTKNIREVLNRYCKKGYWISMDFRTKVLQKSLFFRYFRKGISKRTGRPPSRFSSEGEIANFMNQRGFKVRIIKNPQIIDKMNTIKKFNLNKEEVLKQGQNFKVYVMSLKND